MSDSILGHVCPRSILPGFRRHKGAAFASYGLGKHCYHESCHVRDYQLLQSAVHGVFYRRSLDLHPAERISVSGKFGPVVNEGLVGRLDFKEVILFKLIIEVVYAHVELRLTDKEVELATQRL